MIQPTLKQKIKASLSLMSKKEYFTNIGSNNSCYSFYFATNENLNYYYHLPSMEGKDVLVPTASGDHAFNAIFLGANSVETFDINALTPLVYELKETAIKHLSREEYIDFIVNKNFIYREMYDKFSKHLSAGTKKYFDSIYNFIENFEDPIFKIKCVDYLLAESSSFSLLTSKKLIHNNPYLKNEDTYLETREKISKLKKNVVHKLCPAHKIGNYFEQKDIVIFSNILTYYFDRHYSDRNYNIKNKQTPVAKEFTASLSKILKNDGFASLSYNFYVNRVNPQDDCYNKLGIKTEKIFIPKHDILFGGQESTDRIDIAKKENNPILTTLNR